MRCDAFGMANRNRFAIPIDIIPSAIDTRTTGSIRTNPRLAFWNWQATKVVRAAKAPIGFRVMTQITASLATAG